MYSSRHPHPYGRVTVRIEPYLFENSDPFRRVQQQAQRQQTEFRTAAVAPCGARRPPVNGVFDPLAVVANEHVSGLDAGVAARRSEAAHPGIVVVAVARDAEQVAVAHQSASAVADARHAVVRHGAQEFRPRSCHQIFQEIAVSTTVRAVRAFSGAGGGSREADPTGIGHTRTGPAAYRRHN